MRRDFCKVLAKSLLVFSFFFFSCSKPFPDFNFLLWLTLKSSLSTETDFLHPDTTKINWTGQDISSGGNLDLGTTRINSTSQFSFSLKNNSANPISSVTASMSGERSDFFKVSLSNSVLPANGEITVNLSFAPLVVQSNISLDLVFQNPNSSLTWKVLAKSIPDRYIFITTTTHNGNLGGVTGADSICASQKANQYSSLAGTTYKALLIASTRKVCTTANCGGGISENLNWVLEPNRKYYSNADIELFQTNSSAYPSLPLQNALDSNTGKYWWTGLFTDWTISSGDQCNNWTDSSAFAFGFRGRGGQTSLSALAMGLEIDNSCDKLFHVVCVEQP